MATSGDDRGAGAERAFVPELPTTGHVVLDADESRHLVRSRRVGVGATVVLFDGCGGSRFARLETADPRGATLRVGEPAPDREPAIELTVAISPPEGGRADDLVSALAELGVSRLVWVEAERTPARRLASTVRRVDRQQRRAREAAKVNGRSRLLEVCEGGPLGAWLETQAPGAVLFLDPDPACPALLEALRPGPTPVLVVGPEGGFTSAECTRAAAAGHARARLGACVLRVATAAIAAAAAILAARS